MLSFLRSGPASLLFALTLVITSGAGAQVNQEQTPQEQAARAQAQQPVDREALQQLRQDLINGQEALQPLIDAVDVGPAEAWITESPLERLRGGNGTGKPF